MPPRYKKVAPKFSHINFSISIELDNWPPDKTQAAKQLDQTLGRFETLPRVIIAFKKRKTFTQKNINLRDKYLDLPACLKSNYIHQIIGQPHLADENLQVIPPKYMSPSQYESIRQVFGQDIL